MNSSLIPGQWSNEVIWVVGSGPSADLVNLEQLNDHSLQGHVRVIAVNHAVHHLPDADICYSKDLGMWLRQYGCKTCCLDLPARFEGQCVYSVTWGGINSWSRQLSDVHVIPEVQRRRSGVRHEWPTQIWGKGLITCGNSGIGAVCLADILGGGRSTIRIAGLDMDTYPYDRWADLFVADSYDHDVRCAVEVVGKCRLFPTKSR